MRFSRCELCAVFDLKLQDVLSFEFDVSCTVTTCSGVALSYLYAGDLAE